MVSLSSSFICGNGQVWTRNNPPHSVFPFISRHSVRHCVQIQPFDVFPQHNMMDADSKRAPLSLSYSARQSLCRLFLLQSPTFSLRIQSREGNNTVIVDWQPCRRLYQFLVSKLNLFSYFFAAANSTVLSVCLRVEGRNYGDCLTLWPVSTHAIHHRERNLKNILYKRELVHIYRQSTGEGPSVFTTDRTYDDPPSRKMVCFLPQLHYETLPTVNFTFEWNLGSQQFSHKSYELVNRRRREERK